MSATENKFKSEPVTLPEPVASVNCEHPGDIEWYDAGKMSDGADLYSEEQMKSLAARLEVAQDNWQNMRGCLAAAEKELEHLKEVGNEVLLARDSDSPPTGHPGHEHKVPGVWDQSQMVCLECEAYFKLARLTKLPKQPEESTVVTLDDWLIRTPTMANLRLAAELFFEPGVVFRKFGKTWIQYGASGQIWNPCGDYEHAMHLAHKVGAKVFYDKGMQIEFIDLCPRVGEQIRRFRIETQFTGDAIGIAVMRKIAQVAVYLAKCQEARNLARK